MSERWNEVFANEELVKEIITLQPEEVYDVLAKNGYDFSLEEIVDEGKEINDLIAKYKNGEVDEDALDDVTGGGHGAYFVIGIAIGLAVMSCGW